MFPFFIIPHLYRRGVIYMDETQLVDSYVAIMAAISRLTDERDRHRADMARLMESRDASMLEGTFNTVRKTVKAKHDHATLIPLLEMLSDDEIRKAYIPEVTIPWKFHAGVLNTIGRQRGGKIKRIIEDARIEQEPTFNVEPKATKKGGD